VGALGAAAPSPAHGGSGPPDLERARALLVDWRLDEAERLLGEVPSTAPTDATVLAARLDLQRSRHEAVVERLAPRVEREPTAFEARVVLGRALYALGRHREAYAVLDAMADAYNADRVSAPRDLMWLGVGLHLTDFHQAANRAFMEALAKDRELDEVRLLRAELFIEKYDLQHGDRLYQEVLARRPEDPRALVGRARVDVLGDRAFARAQGRLEAALARAPQHVPAHNLLARIELENERPRAAIARLTEHSLAIAPRDPEALAILGAAHQLADERDAFERVEARATAANPRFAEFYLTVADHVARVHRYAEAVPLYEKAAELAGGAACEADSPDCHRAYWRALSGLGTTYSRLGDDAKARRHLERAFFGDAFDVRTRNLLAHFYDQIDRHYEWISVPPMRLRVHRRERPILERYVPPLLAEAYAFYRDKYGFEPRPPLHVEIFPDVETFAIRSTGLPRLSAHGICFGHVITARSPAPGDFNWAEVLWHELAHVFHIQLSNSRVPRWFTEGLALLESTEGRPEWRRDMDQQLLEAQRAGRLSGVADFNLSFTQARSLDDILVAYYHAYKVAHFLRDTFGFDRLRRMLVLWGEGRSTEEVFRLALDVELDAFDARFSAWLEADLRPLAAAFTLDLEPFRERSPRWEERARAAPDDPRAQADAALAAWVHGEREAALRFAERAIAAEAPDARALYVRAAARSEAGDHAGARGDLERIVALGHDGGELRARIAALADRLGDVPGTIEHLRGAIAQNPRETSYRRVLIDALDKAGRAREAHAERKSLAEVDQASARLVWTLLEEAEDHGASREEIVRWGERGNHIAPFSADHHALFARELARVGDAERARFEAESALLLDRDNALARRILSQL